MGNKKHRNKKSQPWKPAPRSEEQQGASGGAPVGPELGMCPSCCSMQEPRTGYGGFADLQVFRALSVWDGALERVKEGRNRSFDQRYVEAAASLAVLLTTRVPPFPHFSHELETVHCLCPELSPKRLENLTITSDPSLLIETLRMCDECQPFRKDAFGAAGEHYIELLAPKCGCADADCMDIGGMRYHPNGNKEEVDTGVVEKAPLEVLLFYKTARRFILGSFALALDEFQRSHDPSDEGAFERCFTKQLGNIPRDAPLISQTRGGANAVPPPSEQDLRFCEGDRVFCYTGDWAPGKIVREWYREPNWPPEKWAPYQVLLDPSPEDDGGGRGMLIWVPNDSDFFCRLATPIRPGHLVRVMGLRSDGGKLNGKVGVVRGAGTDQKRLSLAARGMLQVCFGDGVAQDVAAANLHMIGGPVPVRIEEALKEAVASGGVPVAFMPEDIKKCNPAYPAQCSVCMVAENGPFLARRGEEKMIVECLECAAVYTASQRYLHDPRLGDGAGLVEAVEGWLEDSYLLSHEALDTIEKLPTMEGDDDLMSFVRAAFEGVKID